MKVNFYKLLCKFLTTGKTNNMNSFGKELQKDQKKSNLRIISQVLKNGVMMIF